VRLIRAVICLTLGLAGPAGACQLALVLAMDVSRSVDPGEYRLIQHGTAEAFRNPEISELLGAMNGGTMVTVTQWSGPNQQRQMIPWRHITSSAAAHAMADEIDAMTRYYRYGLTSPGEALLQANGLWAHAPAPCKRRVIDISGDGVRNVGLLVGPIADMIGAQGVIVNGLVVRGDTPDPLVFYQTEIKRGPLGFIQVAKGYDDFPRAMFLKLLREISPSLSRVLP